MFLAIFSNALCIEKLKNGSERTVLKIPKIIAPYQCAILPLVEKDSLPDFANELKSLLKLKFKLTYDEKDAIGRRNRRHAAQGTPVCITVDLQTIKDKTFTIRDRYSMIQNRI